METPYPIKNKKWDLLLWKQKLGRFAFSWIAPEGGDVKGRPLSPMTLCTIANLCVLLTTLELGFKFYIEIM